jgi:pyruvate dehydrogenase (quinone)
MLGFKGIFVDNPGNLRDAWQEALSCDRPVVLQVKTDPDVPPLAPHITLKEARSFAISMAKGDGSATNVITDTARQVLSSILHKD